MRPASFNASFNPMQSIENQLLAAVVEIAKTKLLAALGPDGVAKLDTALAQADKIAAEGVVAIPIVARKALGAIVSAAAWLGLAPAKTKAKGVTT